MEESTDDNIYVLGDAFMEHDDQLMAIQDEFSPQKRKHIFTLEDFHDEDGILIENESVDDILMLPKHPKLAEEKEPVVPTPVDNAPTVKVEPGPSEAPVLYNEEEELSVPANIEADTVPENSSDESFLIEHIDIRSPVSLLQTLLEKKLNVNLSGYEFWLQNAQLLNPEKNLVDQCIQGEGLVQINMELNEPERRIVIADVLKPTEEFLKSHKEKTAKKSTNIQWMVDNNFRQEMARLEVPEEPRKWTKEQVKLWLVWAVRQFNVPGVKLTDWAINGKELCELTLERFREICPKDRGDFFWTHLELLRRCGLLAIVAKPEERMAVLDVEEATTRVVATSPPQLARQVGRVKDAPKKSRILGSNSVINERRTGLTGSKLGNNGQIQLWQFLLELLTDKNHINVIHWISNDGEFKLENPEMVAILWGVRKNKPAMTYEKLSRALRYYYDGDMIAKVHGKRFVYKFVCDLKELLGYSAADLNRLVTECAVDNGVVIPSADFIS